MLKLVERGFFKAPPIRLSAAGPEGANPPVQVLRVGKFNHPKYGEFEINKQVLAEMKLNFEKKVRGVDIAFDYFHDSDKEASGWPTALYLMEDGQSLWAEVDWTPAAQKKLSEREIRYFSPDFAFEWEDPETGVIYKNVLFGGGLTNRPFVKDMAAIVAHENEGDSMDKKAFDELQAKVLKLSEDGGDLAKKHEELQKAHSALMEKHGALQKKMDEMGEKPAPEAPAAEGGEEEPQDLEAAKKLLGEQKAKLAEYAEKEKVALAEKSKAEEAKKMAEKERDFNILLSEGKACAAQKKAYLSGDMTAFIKLAQPVNLNPNGSSSNPTDDSKTEREDRVLKLAEEKAKKDGIPLHEAIVLANKEIK